MANSLKSLRTISWLFDELFTIPGTRFKVGLDALLGLLPGGGDVVGGAVSAYALVVAARLGAPPVVVGRMALNIVVDTVIGAIPFLGDLFDVGWKANRRNLILLEKYTAAPATVRRTSSAVVVAAIVSVLTVVVGVAAATVWLFSRLF